MRMVRYAGLSFAVLIACAGCERDAATPGRRAAEGGAGTPETTAAPLESVPQPVQRWECDGGTELTTKYLPRDRAISLGLHEGERKLPQVASASGEKYQEGLITFWRKGGSALYERAPAPQIACRLASG